MMGKRWNCFFLISVVCFNIFAWRKKKLSILFGTNVPQLKFFIFYAGNSTAASLSIRRFNAWPLLPFREDYCLTSHTIHVVYVIHEWWNLQHKADSERQIFEKPFMAILFTLIGFVWNLLRGCRQRNIFILMSDLWFETKHYI